MLRRFCELLPVVKSEFDSIEDEVNIFETLGADSAVLDQVTSTSTRLGVLESGVRCILDIDQVR